MWASLFTIAVAASIGLSVVNLASELNKIEAARHLTVVKYSTPAGAPPSERATEAGGTATRKNAIEPGA
jgi:hypothetical protein